MFSTDDTIVAILTPPGRGGIGVVRGSGGRAREIAAAILDRAEPLVPRHATLCHVKWPATSAGCRDQGSGVGAVRGRGDTSIDHVIATCFLAPASYTGEDVVEIGAHGSPVVLREIVRAALGAGARLAEPGEFTLRAFLNGRLDLIQAEAVADLVDAVTPLQARVACDQLDGTLTAAIADIDRGLFDLIARFEASIDFPEEGYHFVDAGSGTREVDALAERIDALLSDADRGRLVREGLQVVVSGKVNVGKSCVFNELVGTNRAIVTPVAGTTRDLVIEVVDLDGLCVGLVDTAGIPTTADVVESEGVTRARGAASVADLVVVVLDRSQPLDEGDAEVLADTAWTPRVIVVNKGDLPAAWTIADLEARLGASAAGARRAGDRRAIVQTAAVTGEGLAELRARLVGLLEGAEPSRGGPAVTNIRLVELLRRARASLGQAITGLDGPTGAMPEEFVLADLQQARGAIEEITGKRSTEDLLRHIFERFCIGK